MRQVKIFKSIESELWNMEKEINNWAQETGPDRQRHREHRAPNRQLDAARLFIV